MVGHFVTVVSIFDGVACVAKQVLPSKPKDLCCTAVGQGVFTRIKDIIMLSLNKKDSNLVSNKQDHQK